LNSNIDITVLIPTIGRETILQALSSLYESTVKPVEIIVIDDSAAQIVELPDEFNVIIIRTGGNLGYMRALSLGFENASGRFIAILNDDDIFFPTKIEYQINAMQADDSAASICKLRKFSDTTRVRSGFFECVDYSNFDRLLLLFAPIGADATLMIDREKFEGNVFAGIPNGNFGDWCLSLDLYFDLKISAINLQLYGYRQHQTQNSRRSLMEDEVHYLYSLWSKKNLMLNLPSISFANFYIFFIWPRGQKLKSIANLDLKSLIIWLTDYFNQFDESVRKNRMLITAVAIFKILYLCVGTRKIPLFVVKFVVVNFRAWPSVLKLVYQNIPRVRVSSWT
jgi:glycosyltransferase involved in cell wall biosynthesis